MGSPACGPPNWGGGMCTSAWVQFKSAGAQPRGGPPGSQEGSGVESHVFRTPTVVLCVSIHRSAHRGNGQRGFTKHSHCRVTWRLLTGLQRCGCGENHLSFILCIFILVGRTFFFFYHYSPLLYNLNKPSSLRGKENKGGREGRLQVSWDRNLILLRRALGP